MTPQEQEMISGLMERVNSTQLPAKDNDAEALLQQGLGRNPDALYILAQTILVQKYALEQAQKQLLDTKAALAQAQADAQPKHTSFLGGLLGTDRPTAPPPPPPPQYGGGYAPVNTGYAAPQPGYGGPVYAQPGYGYGGPSYGSGGGGFLQTAMTTAAGVVAGEMAFQGIESLMHGFEHHGGYEERGFGDVSGQQNMGIGGGDDYKAFETGPGNDSGSDRFADVGSNDDGDAADNDTADNFDNSKDDSSDSSSDDSGDFSGSDDSSF